jgi:nicotinate phosphoribosyltransferase
MARDRLDAAGLPQVEIFVSGGLDEHDLAAFVAAGAPINAAGVGTRMGVSADAPFIDTAYKLVEYAGRPVMKLSAGKETFPGPKQVFRDSGVRDVIARRDEVAPEGSVPLLELAMSNGERTQPAPTIDQLRQRVEAQLAELPSEALVLSSPRAQVAELSEALRRRADEVRSRTLRSNH